MLLILIVSVVWMFASIQGVAAYSNTREAPYDYQHHDARLGCTSDADKQTGLILAYVNCWGAPTNGWGEVGVRTSISTPKYVTVSADVSITAYLTTGIFGHAQVDVWIYIFKINSDDSLTELWRHCAWTSDDIGSNRQRTYSSFSPAVHATSGNTISGDIYICIRFVAGGAYGATVCYTSSDTTGSARMYVNSITWSY